MSCAVSASLLERWLSAASPDARLLEHHLPGPGCTHRELAERVVARAEAWERAGVAAGDPVLLVMAPGLPFVRELLALMHLGAVPVPVSPALGPATYAHIAEKLRPRATVSVARRATTIVGLLDAAPAMSSIDDGRVVVAVSSECRHHPLDVAGCTVLTTSGSTGMPKAVLHHNDSLLHNARIHMESIGAPLEGAYVASLPGYFSYGLVAGLLGSLLHDHDIVFLELPLYPSGWFDAVTRDRETWTAVTPALLRRLLTTGRSMPASLRRLTIGGDRVLPSDLHALRACFDNQAFTTYGLSEAGPRVFTNPIGDDETRWLALGRPLEGIDVTLLEAYDEGRGTHGELAVRTPTAMRGYLAAGELRCSDFVGEWLRTGDICRRDEHGDLRFVERLKHTIVSGGEKLFPGVIQSVLAAHPAVAAATIEVDPHPTLGSVPVASVMLVAGGSVSQGELRDWCRAQLRAAEVPRAFTLLDRLEMPALKC